MIILRSSSKNDTGLFGFLFNGRTGRRAFTLIELLVVLGLISTLLAIALPNFGGFLTSSRISADQATVKMLNNTTALFRLDQEGPDLFYDSQKTNEELMEALVEKGYLDQEVRPQIEGAFFDWLFTEETWHLGYEVRLEDGFTLPTSGGLEGRLRGGFTGPLKDITIPPSLNGQTITAIDQEVFRNMGLTEVTFAAGSQLERIHARAFYGNDLTSIDFPDSLKRIDLRSFMNNEFEVIKLPDDLQMLEQNAFDGNPLSRITIGASVTTIGNEAFGEHTDQFETAYTAGGAGSYIWDGSAWQKE